MLDRRRMIIWSLISIVAAASAAIAIEKAQPKGNGGLPVGASMLLASGSETHLPGSPGPAASIVIQDSRGQRLEAELITLRPTGFDPAEITRPAGRFLLAVNDRSGQEATSLVLTRETGERLHEVRVRERPRKYQWRQVVNLPPGRYVLSEASHPDWVCRITLIAN